ncbi:carboxypeptidase-like regulatory domain-containing protein [Taibaiella koreensis]|uniref:carboxypeptidase-like regulatory domain-containing protein n=1 Tax=Taibaiella koreensis TaxID=1268548 RepID=UPI0013C32B19|nr:carboxypeptidase-like regulatory domain-containing protein [Taibaiella koreensis]
MRSHYRLFAATLLVCLFTLPAKAQKPFWDNVIQISGVTMTADSLRAVPDVTVEVKNKDRGAYSSKYGVFSLVCSKGDTLKFSAVGFRSKEYAIPRDIDGQYFNMVQLMVQDTFYLAETIIRPLPYGDEFDYAFKYWEIPDDKYAVAQKNTSKRAMAYLRQFTPKDGRENQAYYQAEQARQGYYYGQQRPIGIFNPFKWGEFFNAWKRGDFKRKNDDD